MATTTEEITVDIDALDAEAGKKAANGAAAATTESEPVKVETSEPAKQVVTPEEGVKKLQKQLEDEKAARIAAESRAQAEANDAAKARGEVQTTQLDLIKGAIEKVTQANDVLETQYAEAMAAQDFKGAAKAQR